ncbi:hypothetical protein AtNW77_Chr4g0294271 [Arabidopsis thaliana]|uniref:Uncharacterized protein n=5 Tax=Arabidopsis TaxID=3701 RepID=A0A178UW05_ARATH|nr:uncharacterized protein AT4G18335 [Arabidopsis thaliana]KAG7616470.1 hypothetical protein ISN45_At04g019370 [Arabidopsis thaliana x Arabidopsis arenosa]KAG7620942.1 hypothetical protein ISN44_As04g018910 [Arabidopsis suecica]ABE65528.1 hypothetical protein At4g18335 [Arabidopsis thaliana]AEE84028.1 hypothetical protein AT4G18335 [Arabidopsis thaliana]OAO98216.1 hypothetical protein AXX17_AT4G21530 [Arabidopsis thaliana]|eukprot:NP_680718.1 hypothetical protein AT4G18335 [Arabidopsis thaliana]
MEDLVLMKQSLLKSFIVSLILTLVFLISPSSSSSNQETRVSSTQKTEAYLNGYESPHQLVYIKKTTPFILNQRLQRDNHRRRRYNHQYYYYYRHTLRHRRGLHHRAGYFKMMAKKNNGLNRPVRQDTFSVMLPKGFVPPSGSSPCHNQNPNSATTLFCDLSTQP